MESLPTLAVWGPLGVWAIVVTVALVAVYKELGKARDAHTADTAKLSSAPKSRARVRVTSA